jgi:hypothetical protein
MELRTPRHWRLDPRSLRKAEEVGDYAARRFT